MANLMDAVGLHHRGFPVEENEELSRKVKEKHAECGRGDVICYSGQSVRT